MGNEEVMAKNMSGTFISEQTVSLLVVFSIV